jgi:hypothetical protein
MLHVISVIAQACGCITAFAASVMLFVKPVRNRVLGLTDIREGQKCLLRSEMLRIYYLGRESGNVLRQYEFENFCLLYAAYKAENGNSFIDKIKTEVRDFDVVT